MLQRCYLALAEAVLVLVSPSKEILSIQSSKNVKKSEFEVGASDLLFSQCYQRLIQC